MAEEQNTEGQQPQNQPDAQGQSAGGEQAAGKGTDSQQAQGQQNPADDKKFTQADVDRMFQKRLTAAVKAELKKMAGEGEGQPSVDELQRGLETATRDLRFYQARDQVEDFIADKRNQANIKNIRAFCRYFKDDFSFDDEEKVTNLKDLYARAKVETPELLGIATGSIDAAAGNGQAAFMGDDMNARLRAARR